MALKTVECRKRTFIKMSCDNGLPIKMSNHPLNAPIMKNQKRAVLADNNYKFKFDFKFAYIDNQPPRKRQKLSHPPKKNKNKHKKQCNNTKSIIHYKPSSSSPKTSKLHRKAPILHHSVINERWNMLIINPKKPRKPKTSNLPILAILNEYKPSTNDNTPKTIDFHNNSDDLISNNGSMDSYDAAYDHFDDNDIPTISINDCHPQNIQKIQNVHNLHVDRCLFGPSIYYQSVNNNKYNLLNNAKNIVSNPWSHDLNTMDITNNEYKWNINHRSEQQQQIQYQQPPQTRSEVNEGIKDKMKKNGNEQSKDYLFGILRFVFYALIIWIMAINYGIMRVFNGKYILCDIMDLHTMCKDMNGNLDEINFHGLKGNDNEQHQSNSDGLIITSLKGECVKYLIVLIFVLIILRSLYGIIISFITDDTERGGFENGGNVQYFKQYNHQNVIINNYYNNNYIFQ